MAVAVARNEHLKEALLEAQLAQETSSITEKYCGYCRALGVPPNPGVLVFLRLRLPELKPEPFKHSGVHFECRFGDADMFAFCDYLLHDRPPAVFDHWESVDLSACFIGTPGCLMLARVIRLSGCHVQKVHLVNQKVGRVGALALAEAVRLSPTVESLSLQLAFVSDDGARGFLSILEEAAAKGAPPHRLRELDLRNNFLTYHFCTEATHLASHIGVKDNLVLRLEGNLVLDEVLNAVSHAIGTVLVIIGSIFLALAVAIVPLEQPFPLAHGLVVNRAAYVASTTIYSISLFVLYLSSTLYHSLFALGDTVVYIFGIFDHCAIYLLIAGTYTPFLTILFPDKPLFSFWLLMLLWVMAFAGVMVYVLYNGPCKITLQVTSYLVMGWAAVFCVGDILTRMGPHPAGIALLVGGGIAYTAGVPFYAKSRRTLNVPDHTIWHIFVMAGSLMHYFCVLYYIVPYPYE